MKETNLKKSKKLLKIILIIVLFLALIVGGFYGTKFIYHQGVNDGYQDFKTKTEEKLSSLGAVVREKSEFSDLIKETLSDLPEEADEEDFENYLENLENIISKINTENIKNELNNYKNNVSDFLDFYKNSENNNEISEKYNEIKISANELSENLTNIFNEKIKSSVEALKN